MAKKQIEIEILANGKPATKSIDKVSKKTKKLGTTTQKSGSMMKASWAKVGLAIVAVTAALKKATEAHAIQLKAELALSNALRLNAKQGDATSDMWKDYASELQNATIFGDEMTLQQIAMLKTMGLTDDQTKKLIETAMDYATAFGKDVPSAVRELTMTLSGQLGTIKRTIPSIGEFTKEELKNGDVIEAVSKLMKGQAQALADTPWGEAQQNANAFGDEMERLGATFLQFISDVGITGGLKNVLSFISDAFTEAGLDVEDLKTQFADDDIGRRSFLIKQIGYLDDMKERLGDSFDASFWGFYAKALEDSTNELAKLNAELIPFIDANDSLEMKIANLEFAINGMNKAFELGGTTLAVLLKKMPDAEQRLQLFIQVLKDLKAQQDDTNESIVKQKTSLEKAAEGFKEYANKATDYKKVGMGVAKGIEDAFVNMAMGVKTSFKDMANAIIADLIRIAIRSQIVRPIAGMLGFLHTGTAEVKHTGGAIGSTRIPSFHTGVRSDERMAKLQVGEAVINRGGAAKNRASIEAMNKGYSVGGGASQVTTAEINFNVQAIDAVSFNNYLVNNRGTIEGIINSSLTSNGSVRRTIKQVV